MLTAESSWPPGPVPSPGYLGGALRKCHRPAEAFSRPSPSEPLCCGPATLVPGFNGVFCVALLCSVAKKDRCRVCAGICGTDRGACAHQGTSSSRPQPSARWRRAHGLCTFPCGPAARGPGSPRDFPDLPPCHLAGSGVCVTHCAVCRAPWAPRPYRITLRTTAVSSRLG